ncbi:hypothetical protein BDR22DRAFT_543961 [Usnea florida]
MNTSLSTVVGSDTTTSKEKTEITKEKPPQRETPGGVGDRRLPLILIGHNFANDMRILDEDGIDLHEYFDIIGIADTQVLVEESENTVLPRSLSGLALQYQLHDAKESPRNRGGKGSLIFDGAHNAGNDAIANLQLLVCLLFDSVLNDVYSPEPGDYMDDVMFPDENRYERWPRGSMKPNLILMCFDYEGVSGKTSEYGFA